jgi:hypothetical protein
MGIENFAIHLAYSTFPTGNEQKFIESKLGNFTKYIEDTENCMIEGHKVDTALYRPLVFHLFGTFDVVFISLIDNYKFCQKVFDEEPTNFGVTTNYQIVTGICDSTFIADKDVDRLKGYFPATNAIEGRKARTKFVHITNFKVNNGLLIGNGNHLIHAILKTLANDLGNADFIIFKSFSWSEIILIQFCDDLDKMQENVIRFRELKLRNVCEATVADVAADERMTAGELEKNSLYASLFDELNKFDKTNKQLINSHVFVDTHSYSGVDYFQFNAHYDDVDNPYKGDHFKSSIELQVKPGHLNQLYSILQNKEIFDATQLKFKNGKTDFLVKEISHGGFESNYKVNQVYRHKGNELKEHVRKLKTNYLFDMVAFTADETLVPALKPAFQDANDDQTTRGIVNFNQVLAKEFTINVTGLKKEIKKLGLSRQLREKILKAFSNYNNLIKDPILYGEFIELKEYLSFLMKDIEKEIERLNAFFDDPVSFTAHGKLRHLNLRTIEKKWTSLLEIYEDAYHNRVHNNYLYEDINEFSIDFNSAVNQINSLQDFVVKNVNNVFFPYFKDQIIVTQNEVDSKSNVVNVNYNVYHYLEPALIFTTLFKEVMNGVVEKAGKNTKAGGKEFYFERIFTPHYFSDLKKAIIAQNKAGLTEGQAALIAHFDFFYFFSDITKMAYTFLFDYQLYEFWCWTYFLQDSSMYTSKGLPDSTLFQKELLRIALIKEIFEDDETRPFVKNPAPEIFDLWQKHIEEVTQLARLIVHTDAFMEAKDKFSHYILDHSFGTITDAELGEVLAINSAREQFITANPESTVVDLKQIVKITRQMELGLLKLSPDIAINYNLSPQFKLIKYHSILFETYLKTGDKGFENMDGSANGAAGQLKRENFYMICAVGHATLSLFQKEIKTTRILRRNWQKGHPVKEFTTQEFPGVFIDPCGGFFYNAPEVRKKCFGYVNMIIDYLWHAAEVDKKRLFTLKN